MIRSILLWVFFWEQTQVSDEDSLLRSNSKSDPMCHSFAIFCFAFNDWLRQLIGPFLAIVMAAHPGGMLEYFTRDQEALHGVAGPWFPPLSSDLLPVNLQLIAITEHDFVRSEQTPVTFTLHQVGQNGTRVEYLVRLVAMTTVTGWNNDSELASPPKFDPPERWPCEPGSVDKFLLPKP
jgi:hypothetical protein